MTNYDFKTQIQLVLSDKDVIEYNYDQSLNEREVHDLLDPILEEWRREQKKDRRVISPIYINRWKNNKLDPQPIHYSETFMWNCALYSGGPSAPGGSESCKSDLISRHRVFLLSVIKLKSSAKCSLIPWGQKRFKSPVVSTRISPQQFHQNPRSRAKLGFVQVSSESPNLRGLERVSAYTRSRAVLRIVLRPHTRMVC